MFLVHLVPFPHLWATSATEQEVGLTGIFQTAAINVPRSQNLLQILSPWVGKHFPSKVQKVNHSNYVQRTLFVLKSAMDNI